MLGYRSDIADLLAAADVMVLPSLYEGTAGIALEAMCLGTPIVSTRLDGMEGILVDGRNALIVEPGDVGGIAAAVEQVLRDRGLAERLGAAGHDDFLARFTIDRSADNMAAMFSAVAGPQR
jgi:glycosyltransferase involved in cell wall biosynthesis